MNVESEKAFYDEDVRDALRNINADTVIWGEDLYDASIVVYAKNLKDLIGNKSTYKTFVNAELVFFNFDSVNFVKHTNVKWDEKNKTAFLSEGNFNGCWKHLKNSIRVGMRIHKEEVEQAGVRSPLDLVDFYSLQSSTRRAYVKNDRIAYRSAEQPKEAVMLMGKKQSILDNPKNRFFYSKTGGYFHVKDCDFVKTLSPEVFTGSGEIPEGYEPCYKCVRRIYLRIACDPYVKQIPTLDRMLQEYDISKGRLEKYIFTYGLRFHLGKDGNLIVEGAEDTWIIKGFGDEILSLWHNNYTKTGPRERCITSGFHDQKVKGRDLGKLFEYIHNYSFEKHLAAEERAAAAENEAIVPIIEKNEPKEGILKRAIRFVKKMFRRGD